MKASSKMNMTSARLWHKWALLTLVGTVFVGCTTFSKKQDMQEATSLDEASNGQIIVHQPGAQEPIISTKDQKYWIKARSTAKSAFAQMHASLATGDASNAENLARQYLKAQPGHLDALTVLAASLALQRKHHLANYYGSIIERKRPNSAVALNLKGITTLLKPGNGPNDYRLAVEYFQKAVDSDVSDLAAGMNLGHLYLDMAQPAKARDVFAQIKQRCQECEPAQLGYAVASHRAGHYGDAKSALEEILDKNPKHPKALFHLAIVFKRGYNDKQKAEEHMLKLSRYSQLADVELRERANTILRKWRGEHTPQERLEMASETAGEPTTVVTGTSEDAEALMNASDFNEGE